jgi:hypothetical protein
LCPLGARRVLPRRARLEKSSACHNSPGCSPAQETGTLPTMSPRLQKLIGIALLWATLGVAAMQTLL